MAVVTVSREVGAGGTWLALKIADALGGTCVDKELIHELAGRLNKTQDEIQDFDQDTYSRISVFFQQALASIASGGRVFHTFGLGPIDPDGVDLLRPYPEGDFRQDDYVDVLRQTMIDIASRYPHAVILGRGGQRVFADHPGAVHVRIVADRPARIARLREERGIDQEQAEKLIDARDESARRFLVDLFDVEPSDPHLYHLIINTSKIALDKALAIILDLVGSHSTLAVAGSGAQPEPAPSTEPDLPPTAP